MEANYYRAAAELYNRGNLSESKLLLIKGLTRNGRDVPSLHLLSRIHFLEQDVASALGALDRALTIEPGSMPLLFGRAIMLSALGRHGEALEVLDAVLQSDPDNDEAHNNRGNALLALGRPEEALQAYSRSSAINPGNADAIYNTGVTLEHFGNTALAARFLREAVRLAPGNAQFRRSLADCVAGRHDDDNIAAMELMLLDPALPPEARMRVNFGLGKTYDDLGDIEAAFRHYAEGNALRRGTIGYDEAAALQLLRPPAAATERHEMGAAAMAGRLVPIFVLGMPRSGSTLVEQILSRHPLVTPAGETGLFSRLADEALTLNGAGKGTEAMLALPPEHCRRLGADYLDALQRRHPGARFLTDKTPVNFRYLPLIRAALPDAAIVHTRRDARDTCLSCFFRLFTGDSQPFSYDLGELGRYYAAYETLMDHWRHTLPPASFLDITYEKVVADLQVEARRLLAHCSLAWNDRCLAPHEGQRFVASDSQVLKPIYTSSIGRWRRYAGFLGGLGPNYSPS